MELKADWIENPIEVWDEIRSRLLDQSGELNTNGPFIGVFDRDELVGAFLVRWWNEYCCEMHGGIKKEYFGNGPEICDLAGMAIFYSTPCLKIVAIIPEFNRLMRKCVQKIGMKQEGIITKSFLKWMRLHDQIIYGITKREMKERSIPCLPH